MFCRRCVDDTRRLTASAGLLAALSCLQTGAAAKGARALHRLPALASQDDASASLDDAVAAESDIIRAVEQLEVEEPALEQSAESAAAAVAAAFAFGAGVWAVLGRAKGEGAQRGRGIDMRAARLRCQHVSSPPCSLYICAEYFAGYLLEQSLSVDNLFVFILVFKYFKTPVEYQSTVLGYGIATAAVLRLVLIVVGVDIVGSWKPVLLFFAGILLFSSYKLLT